MGDLKHRERVLRIDLHCQISPATWSHAGLLVLISAWRHFKSLIQFELKARGCSHCQKPWGGEIIIILKTWQGSKHQISKWNIKNSIERGSSDRKFKRGFSQRVLFLADGPPCKERRYKTQLLIVECILSRSEFHQRKAAHANHNSHTTMGSLFFCNINCESSTDALSSRFLYVPEARRFKLTNAAFCVHRF